MKKLLLLVIGLFALKLFIPTSSHAQYCNMAVGPNSGINTALGCLPLDRNALTILLLNWSVGIAGGIAFILIVVAAAIIATGQGNPKHVQVGTELLNASITGLVFIVLSVVILNFLGVNVLGLSSLGFNL